MSNPSPLPTPAFTSSSAFPYPVPTPATTRAALRKRRALASDVALENGTPIYLRREQQTSIRDEDAFMADSEDSFHGKDVNHSRRGEAVLENIHVSKKAMVTVAHRDPIRANLRLNLHRRHIDGSSNKMTTKIPWHALTRDFARSLLLFILLAGSGTTYWRWRKPRSSLHAPMTMLKVEELERLAKKTIKMMQEQLDLVDVKILKELEALRTEMEKRMVKHMVPLGAELGNVKARMDDVQELVGTTEDVKVPTREDIKDLVNSIVGKGVGASPETLSLDDVHALARKIVEAEIEKHSADAVATVDYALGTGGGKVVDHSERYLTGRVTSWSALALSLLAAAVIRQDSASKILEPSFGEPGQCLPLKGSNVYVDIALRTAIFPEAVTLEHVSESVAYDISSAPKDFRVFGWLHDYKEGNVVPQSMIQYLLGEFTYDMEKTNVQTFSVSENSAHKLINMVKLMVMSNYGSSSHTCIYRFRVHGSDPLSANPPTL